MRMTRKRHRQQERKRPSQGTMTKVLHHLKSFTAATALLAFLTTGESYAMPQDGAVTAGNATITQNGNAMAIQQMTDKVAINWQSFNIGANEKVAFNQPNAQSVALNRIIGNNASTIYGQLSANGKVFLVNANGILFAPGAEVNVGGLVASTHSISDTDFMKGNYTFGSGAAQGKVINQGNITAQDGGYIVLIGNQVSNSGSITASGGTAALAVGGQVVLDAPGDGLVNLIVNQNTANASIQNSGTIQADGGKVLLTGQASGDLLFSVINNSGMISAKSVQEKNGVIILDGGSNGTVEVGGRLDVSGQHGGTVKVLGEAVKLHSDAAIDASGAAGGGEVLVGGNWQGQGTEARAANVVMEQGAVIRADALQSGNGGKVVLWSDQDTRFHGTITAKGGATSGNGGMVETSGKNFLAADGSVNVSAAAGKGGTWLLDPRNVIIQAKDSTTEDYNADGSPTRDNATVAVESINAALTGGTSVVITTGADGSQDGNIAVAADIIKSSGGDATLTLSAANNIVIKSGKTIKSESGKLNVELNADSNSIYGGIIQLQNGSSIYTNGGNITMYGQNDSTNGYARSITTALPGIQLLGTTLDAGGGNITLRGQNTATPTGSASALGISVDGISNSLLTSGAGKITLAGDAGTNGISITDTAAQISAGSGDIILTADRMELGGKIGKSGDTGTLTIQPLSQTTSIGIGDNSTGTLKLASSVFSNVINSALTKVTIGRNDSAGITNMGTVTFHNNVLIQAPGLSVSPEMQGAITITGDVANDTDRTITLHSAADTTTANKITTGGLELLGANVKYEFTNSSNKVGTLAADTGKLTYSGTGTTVIGTVGSTSGLNLGSTGSVRITEGALTVSGPVTTHGTVELNASKGMSSSGAVTIVSTISSNGGDITISDAATTLAAGSKIDSTAGAQHGKVTITSTDAVTLAGTDIKTGGGNLLIEGASLNSSGSNTLNGGNGTMTFKVDTISVPVNTMSVTGAEGIVNIQTKTAGRLIDLGGFAGNASHLQLDSHLFNAGGAFSSNGYKMLYLGNTSDNATLSVGSGLTFAAPTTIQSGGNVDLTATAGIDNTATDQPLTILANTITSAQHAKVVSGAGLLTLAADHMTFDSDSSFSTTHSGRLWVNPKTTGLSVGLGSAAGSLQLNDDVFANVFKQGFSDITVAGTGIAVNGLTSVHDDLTLQSAGTISLDGDLTVDSNKTITMISTGAMQNAGSITASGLQLRGGNAVYKLEQGNNAIGRLAANTGSVFFKGQDVTVGTVTNAAHGELQGIAVSQANEAGKVNLESASGKTLTIDGSILSDGGDIILTANAMKYESGQISSSGGKLQLRTVEASRNIDLDDVPTAAYTGTGALHLNSAFFTGVQPGFDSVVIGRDDGYGKITVAGNLNFANHTVIQSPNINSNPAGSIDLIASANLATTDEKSVSLIAKTITAASGAQINSAGDVHLTADTMSLADSNITGVGTLYLRPLKDSTNIDLGAGFSFPQPNHLQFGNWMFTGANKVFNGFNKYTIGGNVTNKITVYGTADFHGSLETQSPILTLEDNSILNPSGSVTLRDDEMNFGSGATVMGLGDLTLTPYTAGKSMLVGAETGADLTISKGAFTGIGRNQVFAGQYNGTLTFGDANVAKKVTISGMTFDSTALAPSSSFENLQNLTILAQRDGEAEISGATLNIEKDITIKAGKVTTDSSSRISSSDGDIKLISNKLALAGQDNVRGMKNLYLQTYDKDGTIAIGGGTAKLELPQTLFYNGASDSGAIGSQFERIFIGREDGTGAISINNAVFQNNLTVLSETGKITLNGELSSTGQNITLETTGEISQTTGAITANTLAVHGGKVTLSGNNKVDTLAAQASELTFHNAQDLTIGTVTNATHGMNTTSISGIHTMNKADVSSTNALNIDAPVTSDKGDILLSGTRLVINKDIKTGSSINDKGDITLTGNTMSIADEAKVKGYDQLKIQTLSQEGNISFNQATDALLLDKDWFSSSTKGFQNGFNRITIGRDNGIGTVTVDNTISFADAVTLQSPGGKVIMDGTVNTSDAITLKGQNIETKFGSSLNAGSGTVTLQGDQMDFSGGVINGTGDLVVKPLEGSTGITMGGTAANTLELAAAAFNGNVIQNNFKNIVIGDTAQSGTITVENFAVGTNLELLAAASGGKIVINGELSTNNKSLSITADRDIQTTSTGLLTNIGLLEATSDNGSIKFDRSTTTTVNGMVHTTAFNTINQLGELTAKKDISVFNHGELTLTKAINSGGDTTIFANGDMTLGNDASVKGKNVTLIAEGEGSQYFNNSKDKGKAVQSNGGRWLIYSYSPLKDDDGSVNVYNGLTSNFRRYNVTYAGGFNAASGNGFLYEYQPILTVDSASRTYGNGNSTIVLNFNGLLSGDTLADLGLTGVANITFAGGQIISEASAAGTMYDESNPYKLIYHEDTSTNGTPNSLVSLQGYKIESTDETHGEYIPLTINQRTVIITPDNAEKVYDAQNGSVSNSAYKLAGDGLAEYDGSVGGSPWKDSLSVGLGGAYIQNKNVGSYQIAVDSATISSVNGDNNYIIINKTGTGKITPKELTVTVADATKTYGDANPAITPDISGFAGSDTMDVISGLKVNHAASQYSNVGDYAITAQGASAQNYTFKYENGTLTIIPRETTVTVTAGQQKVYGEKDPQNLTYTASNTVNNDVIKLTRASGENVGQYAISLGSNPNYKVIEFTPANFEISKRPLIITANHASRYYGYDDPVFGFTAQTGSVGTGNGLVNGDKVGSVSFSNALNQYSSAGTTGAITINDAVFSSGTIGNYAITYNSGILTIEKAPLTVVVGNQNKIYGENYDNPTLTVSGFRNGETENSLIENGVYVAPTAQHTAVALADVGQYAITASGGSANNYSFNYVDATYYTPGKLTITPRPLTITANHASRYYGYADPSFGFAAQYGSVGTGNGLINGDAVGSVSFSNALNQYSAAGTTGAIQISDAAFTNGKSGNYAITYNPGTLTIEKAPLTVVVGNQSKVYGESYDNPTLTVSGFRNGETESSLVDSGAYVAPTAQHTAVALADVGQYAITASGGSANNYSFNYVDATYYTPGKLTITPRPLTITANHASRYYGYADPSFGFAAQYGSVGTGNGLINGDAVGSVSFSNALNQYSAAGTTGAIQISDAAFTSGKSGNYAITYNPGILTIEKAPLTVTANDASRIYGDSNPGFTVTYSGFRNGETESVITGLQLTTLANESSNVGQYHITAGNGMTQNYSITYVDGKLIITPATLTYIADPRERTVGEPNPSFSGSIIGFKNQDTLTSSTAGTAVFDSPATSTSPTGRYAINGSGLTANYGNYVFVQDPSNATALNIKGLNPPGQDAVNDVHGYHPTPPTTPGSTIGGGSTVNIGFNGNGAVTVGLANDSNDIGDLTPRKEGISLPVFTRNGGNISPEGLYDVSYNQTSLTVLPSGQNVPPPPAITSSDTPYAPFDLKIGDSTVSFSVQAVNGVVVVTPLTDEAKQVLQKNDKNANKLILANALLTAVNELSVMPDQLLAVLLATE